MSEKFSHRSFDRVVGLTEEMKARSSEVKNYIDVLIEQNGPELQEYELEKTDQEKEVIGLVTVEVDRMLREYGRENPSEMQVENIHVLREGGTSEYTEDKFRQGAHSTFYESILVDRTFSKVTFAIVLFHELMHMRVYKALQVVHKEDGAHLATYRNGFSVTSRDGDTVYFNKIEEAIVGYLTQKFYAEVVTQNPLFTEEISEMEKTGSEPGISRTEELSLLNKVVDRIWEDNQDRFSSRDEVFELFVQAHVTGNLLPVGKLIEQTFGKGSFRRLGEGNLDIK